MVKLHPYALATALLFAAHGFRKGSLSLSGGLSAALIGYLTLANDLKLFGCLMLFFYLTGSRASKFKADIKSKLDESHPAPSSSAKSSLAGNRGATQVICNGIVGCVCSVLWRMEFEGALNFARQCPLTTNSKSTFLILTTIYFFAVTLADTLASELGILSKSRPFLITTMTKVPKGTNGGVSLLGIAVSILGGLLTGIFALALLCFQSLACRSLSSRVVIAILFNSVFAGLTGSILDSLLGATLQETLYSPSKKKIVHARDPKERIQVISGFNVLSNDAVNILSSSITAIGLAWLMYDTLK